MGDVNNPKVNLFQEFCGYFGEVDKINNSTRWNISQKLYTMIFVFSQVLSVIWVLSLLGGLQSIHAFGGFHSRIPNGDSVPSPCKDGIWEGVGHQNHRGSGTLNPFGEDFKTNNYVSFFCLLSWFIRWDVIINNPWM